MTVRFNWVVSAFLAVLAVGPVLPTESGPGTVWSAGAIGSLLPVPARADKPPVAHRVNHSPESASAVAGPGPAKRARPARPRIKPTRASRKVSQFEIYALDADGLRDLEKREMLTIARRMYALNDGASKQVEAEIQRIQTNRWENDESIGQYKASITDRQRLYQALSAAGAPDETLRTKNRRLHRSKEFSKVLRDIRKYERRHPHRFSNYQEQIEALLEAAKVEEAHTHWKERLSEVRAAVKIRGLLSGMSTRRLAKKAGRNTDKSKAAGADRSPRTKRVRRSPGEAAEDRSGKSAGSSKPNSAARSKSKGKKPGGRKSDPARPLNDWEAYVRDFIKNYELSPTQTNSALSILKDMTFRAVQIENANRDKIAQAGKIPDAKLRKQRLEQLGEPIDRLFFELKQRLDSLLTASQHTKAAKAKK